MRADESAEKRSKGNAVQSIANCRLYLTRKASDVYDLSSLIKGNPFCSENLSEVVSFE